MKCQSCSAIVSAGKTECEFCGAATTAPANTATPGDTVNNTPVPQVSFVQDAFNLIGEINSTPSKGFNFLAFLFPVAYLWGYGAHDNAKKVAANTLVPALVVSLLAYLSYRLANNINILATLWVLFVSYLVSTRIHVLAKTEGKAYDLGGGVVAQIVFVLVYYLIMAL
jgi:hypothetical protein